MLEVKKFVFNPFFENTYLVFDETSECIIIDSGCYDVSEKNELEGFISGSGLNPVRLLNTHCHIDHILGNSFVANTYSLKLETHREEGYNIENSGLIAKELGLKDPESPMPGSYLNEGDKIFFGKSYLNVLFTPGHSAGHLSFFSPEQKFVLSGDVLFNGGIGRVDLPGGNLKVLMNSIREKLFPLGDDVKVFSGHGPETTIGFERINNPFLN